MVSSALDEGGLDPMALELMGHWPRKLVILPFSLIIPPKSAT